MLMKLQAAPYEEEELLTRLNGLEEPESDTESRPWIRHVQRYPILPIEEERSSELSSSQRSPSDHQSKSATNRSRSNVSSQPR